MTDKYGFSASSWDRAKAEMVSILLDCARRSDTVAYSDLVHKVKTVSLSPDSYALRQMLGEVSMESDQAGGGMLTVLVVHKGGDRQPGPGFFELARKLGRDTTDPIRCWIEEFKLVCERAKKPGMGV